jgi:DNA-binding MarR family transcriptional regulator
MDDATLPPIEAAFRTAARGAASDRVTLRQFAVLLSLRRGERDFAEVAEEIGMPKSALTHAHARFLRDGLVASRRDPADRRRMLMRLTRDGAGFLARIAHPAPGAGMAAESRS